MSILVKESLSKVPEVTLTFWIVKIAATTLGETAGDAVSMQMNLGQLIGTAIFALAFIFAVLSQIKSTQYHPAIYWTTIIASTTLGTTLADYADRSLGIGYSGGRFGHFLARFNQYQNLSQGQCALEQSLDTFNPLIGGV